MGRVAPDDRERIFDGSPRMKVWKAFVEEVKAAKAEMHDCVGEECLYRGVAGSPWDLAPGLLRMKQREAREQDRLTLEYDLCFESMARAGEWHHDALDGWDRLFYRRHYGWPTRLLDGTEAPGVAVFSAVSNAVADFRATAQAALKDHSQEGQVRLTKLNK